MVLNVFRSEGVSSSVALFPEVDVGKISRNLKLAQRGADAGKQNLPKTNVTNLDAVENQIVSDIERIRRDGLNKYSDAMAAYVRRIEGTPTEVESALLLRKEVETDYQTIFRERTNELVNIKEGMDSSVQEYHEFRQNHKRSRTPKQKDSSFFFWAFVAVIAVVEIVINGFFFADVSARGLLGGIGIAVGIAFINLLASYAFGRFSTWKNHITITKKLIGYLCGLAYLLFVSVFALSVGHYREAYVQFPASEASNVALNTLLEETTSLNGLDSWALIFLSAAISFFMFWKAYNRDDPYPEYYGVWDHMRQSRDAYSDEVEDAYSELKGARDDAIGKIEIQRNDFKAAIEDSRSALSAQAELPAQLELFLFHTTQAANTLLSVYREKNVKHRTTEAPSIFKEMYKFPEVPVERVAADRLKIDTESVEAVNASYSKTIESIGNYYSDSVKGIETIVEAKASDRLLRKSS